METCCRLCERKRKEGRVFDKSDKSTKCHICRRLFKNCNCKKVICTNCGNDFKFACHIKTDENDLICRGCAVDTVKTIEL